MTTMKKPEVEGMHVTSCSCAPQIPLATEHQDPEVRALAARIGADRRCLALRDRLSVSAKKETAT